MRCFLIVIVTVVLFASCSNSFSSNVTQNIRMQENNETTFQLIEKESKEIASKVFDKTRRFYRGANSCTGRVDIVQRRREKNGGSHEFKKEHEGFYEVAFEKSKGIVIESEIIDFEKQSKNIVRIDSKVDPIEIVINGERRRRNSLKETLNIAYQKMLLGEHPVISLILFPETNPIDFNELGAIKDWESADMYLIQVTKDLTDVIGSEDEELIISKYWINKADFAIHRFESEFPDKVFDITSFVREDFSLLACK